MSGFFTLMKMNMKLLLRNKGFLFFLCFAPVLSAAILGIKTDMAFYEQKEAQNKIIELDNCESKAVYNCDDTSKFIIKVYDGSKTELSEYLLNRFADAGIFSVCRSDVREMTEGQVEEQAKTDAFDDRAGVLLYIPKGFKTAVLEGSYQNMVRIYQVSDDERQEYFISEITQALVQMHAAAESVMNDADKTVDFLEAVSDKMPQKHVVNLSGKGVELTREQGNWKALIGWAYAIITLGFLFCGVCIAYTVIEEQNNKVFTRAMLTKLGVRGYFCSKFVMVVFISIVQTFLLGICVFQINGGEFGMNRFIFLFMILCLGLIFGTLSFMLGVLLGDVMSANYAVFTLWSISALLSGLYFPLDTASPAIVAASCLMPQRWFLKAAELFLAGEKGGYSIVFYVTAAYLILCVSVGGIGLKMKRSDV